MRSVLDNTESLANQYSEKKSNKVVVEYEVKFDDKTTIEDVEKQFKGMHVVDKQFKQDNFTGKHNGSAKIKLRLDERQQEIVNRRLEQTPNIKANKVEEGNHNRKFDYLAFSGNKWFSNNLAQESKHYKDKDLDTKDRFLKEFGESRIFGETKNYNRNERDYAFEKDKNNQLSWNKTKEAKVVQPRGYKPMGAIKEGSNLLRATTSHTVRSFHTKK